MTAHKKHIAFPSTMEETLSVKPAPIALSEEKEQVNATPITLKSGDSFLIMDVCGDLLSSRQDMGLFRQGTRFLRTSNLFLEGKKCVSLSHQTSHMSNASHIDLTNVPLQLAPDTVLEQGVIHIDRFIELTQNALIHTCTITNFHTTNLALTLSLTLGADFCDLFEVRGFTRPQHGQQQTPVVTPDGVRLNYRGLDTVERTTTIQITPTTPFIQADQIDWQLDLQRGEPIELRIVFQMGESSQSTLDTASAATLWAEAAQPTITSNDPFFNRLLDRSSQDLMMLSTMTPYGYYPYAGIPWFNCPFGRDGLIAALEFLPLYPQVARGTLEFLAAYQGTKVDTFTDEEPGKILHEFRTGEMAAMREVPYIPYYGTVDATPLFLILFEAYMHWTGDQALLDRLWPNIEAAARWMITYGDRDGDSFLEYHRVASKGLDNQGWKDSWDSINHRDGRIAHSPIALCEVQGYAYAAYRATSYLARKVGRQDEAPFWDTRAETLQENFLQRFWWENEQSIYLALAEDKEPCEVVSSNAGQCLWTGILPDDKARQVVERIMQQDMSSGWGIRTLSSTAVRYNPLSYHNGSVWPHDTALIGSGCALYGEKQAASQLLKSLFDASQHFTDARLPELYCGFERREGYGPTRYPVACSPQAWAAGAIHILLLSLLGLHPNADSGHLTLHQPILPDWLTSLEINGMHVGNQRVHLKFTRQDDHTTVTFGRDNKVDIRIL
ncbi:amylo-alpha-1,6-glucosidase [Dictyobacter arantiisoli]|uniref:Amylo-alpha-1,6-glucosidase n=1 Tax=Dictyobacter arantiisoli TaxID=2014874 RepID=A0A5A5T5P5_9CHLR|nr:glycogen debranching N-terminal domain-containing protein [Dictyobacter arantiisoli]GCF06496.1 amylo-alpha-1,6-glucosidase [Dictyobacter arantiisoli]